MEISLSIEHASVLCATVPMPGSRSLLPRIELFARPSVVRPRGGIAAIGDGFLPQEDGVTPNLVLQPETVAGRGA